MGKTAGVLSAFRSRTHSRGATSFVVAVSMLIIAGLSALAVDYAFLRHRRGVLAAAAERGALAGAAMLVKLGDEPGAVRDATVRAAQAALGRTDSPELTVRASDVVFLKDGKVDAHDPNQVEVTAGLTQARGNPIDLFLGGIFGQPHAEATARARACLYCAKTSGGLGPLALPAGFSWNDACDPQPDRCGNGKLDLASPCETASIQVAGYGPEDVGRRVELSPAQSGELSAGSTFAVWGRETAGGKAAPSASESDESGFFAALGDSLDAAGGQQAAQALRELARQRMRLDPGAYWDEAAKAVRGSRFAALGDSPRTVRMIFFDPAAYGGPEVRQVRVWRLGAAFVENVDEDGTVGVRLVRALANGSQHAKADCDPAGVALVGVELMGGSQAE
jgi:hypothetical protein